MPLVRCEVSQETPGQGAVVRLWIGSSSCQSPPVRSPVPIFLIPFSPDSISTPADGPCPHKSRPQRPVPRVCPGPTIRPSSITTIRSASLIVRIRCATTRQVRPFISSLRPARISSAVWVWVSTLDRASSRIKIEGSRMIARARAVLWRCPPDRVTPRSPTSVPNLFGNSDISFESWATSADLRKGRSSS